MILLFVNQRYFYSTVCFVGVPKIITNICQYYLQFFKEQFIDFTKCLHKMR